jgi:hypothetical protein
LLLLLLRRLFGPKREEVAGVWRKLHIEEVYNLYCLRSIPTVLKLRMIRWTGQVALPGGTINLRWTFWSDSLKGSYHCGVLGADGRLILKLVYLVRWWAPENTVKNLWVP